MPAPLVRGIKTHKIRISTEGYSQTGHQNPAQSFCTYNLSNSVKYRLILVHTELNHGLLLLQFQSTNLYCALIAINGKKKSQHLLFLLTFFTTKINEDAISSLFTMTLPSNIRKSNEGLVSRESLTLQCSKILFVHHETE